MRLVGLVAVPLLLLTGCTVGPVYPPQHDPFKPGATVDYQLGGAYPTPLGVTVVTRDSTDAPAPGLYNICYVNGFQTQPGVQSPEIAVLRDASGEKIVDPNWPDENIIDISSASNRAGSAIFVNRITDRCADAGFDAVEFDNLDSYTRSDGALTLDDAVVFAGLLVNHAHSLGLAAAQKNTAELGTRGRDGIGFDFAVVEECDQFDECARFTEVYGEHVIDVEYTDSLRRPFAELCADAATPRSTLLRDRNLTPAGDPDYVYEHC